EPKDANALSLRSLILSNAGTLEICQGVYDALMKGGASPRGVGSVIALTASDIMQRVGDGDREAFVRAAHGLLFAAAVRLVFAHVQDLAALPLLFTSAAFINALHNELKEQASGAGTRASTSLGGGLIPPSLLEAI